MHTNNFNPTLALLFLGMFIVILMASPVSGEKLTVSSEGNNYESVQAAIDATAPGDTIVITEGVYAGNLVVNKNLSLRGEGSVTVTASPDTKGNPVVAIGSSEVSVTLSGLTFKGAIKGESGTCTDTEEGLCPAGIAVRGDAELTIKGSLITDNYMGGIYLKNVSAATVENNEIVENRGNGVYLRDSSSVTLDNNTIRNNSGGIRARDDSQLTASENTIESSKNEGIDLSDTAQASLIKNTIAGNDDEGIKLSDSSRATIDKNKLSNNGGGIALGDSSEATITSNELTENKIGVGLLGETKATIKDNLITNEEIEGVGIVLLDSAAGTIEGNEIVASMIGIYSLSDKVIDGGDNNIGGKCVELFGNLDGSLRVPKNKPNKDTIVYQKDKYSSLQSAVDALNPGGVLLIEPGNY
ncbi:MAG: right-handed parallel beta-helix repeat-containing protein, partial [Candidatus Bipolaricaulota bacterium]